MSGLSRRGWLRLAGAGAAAGGAIALADAMGGPDENGRTAVCFVARVERYDEARLVDAIRSGLAALGPDAPSVRGKRVLLKPNLVETSRGAPHVNTHPMVVVAAAEVLRSLGAAEVIVGEGQGHRRDSLLVLDESGMGEALSAARLPFVDLNHDEVRSVENAARVSTLERLFLPRTLLEADVVVSLPKVKTHHWAGITCSMKNLFGVMPGVIYGWPKNQLHQVGIDQSILDITAAVRPSLAIADGVIGMEGDGPIMGEPKRLGCVVVGASTPAVDATCARLMGLQPERIPYLAAASGWLGPIGEANVEQRGESIGACRSPFEIDPAAHLAHLRA